MLKFLFQEEVHVVCQASARSQQEQLQRDGFAIFPRIFSRQEAARLADGLNSLNDSERVPAGVEILGHPAVSSLAADPRLTGIVRDLLGPEVFPFRATLLGEPYGVKGSLVWHQDVTLPMRSLREGHGWGPWLVKAGIVHAQSPASALEQVLSLRLPLAAAPPDRALVRVLPGTHLLGVLDDSELVRLTQERPAAGCFVPEGGVLAMKPLLVHAAGEPLSPASSPMLLIDYATPVLLAEGLFLPS